MPGAHDYLGGRARRITDHPVGYADFVQSYDLRHIDGSVQDPLVPDWVLVETNSRSTSGIISGLEYRVGYKVQVRTVYELGAGVWSTGNEIYVPRYVVPRRTPPPPPPATPTPTPTPTTTTSTGGEEVLCPADYQRQLGADVVAGPADAAVVLLRP